MRRVRLAFLSVLALVVVTLPTVAVASPREERPSRHERSADHGKRDEEKRGRFWIEVKSSPPEMVSGDAARLFVHVPEEQEDEVVVLVDGDDQTDHFFVRDEGVLEGVVDGLVVGENTVEVYVARDGRSDDEDHGRKRKRHGHDGREKPKAAITLVDHPVEGPIFSGPHQEPFLCSVPGDYGNAELGGPIDENCTMETVVSFKYRTTGGTWKDYDPAAPRPADMATTTTMDGKTVDYIVRWERGTINRFIYSIAVLSPDSQDVAEPDLSAWNKRLIYYFQGGVAIGHYQGDPSRDRMLYDYGLGKGYAVAYSTGTKTGTHYNLELGGETAIMVKDRFVTAYGVPDYTVGVGGSGGGIQQYVYAQNHKGLIDAAIPQYSYPDMITQTIHIGDCELLERWMDFAMFQGDLTWANWENRSLLEGLAAWNTVTNPRAAAMPPDYPPGSSECINGWMGLSALVLNPHYGTVPGITPSEQAAIEWTHFADAINIYGRAADGYAARTWSNVGVQYGLEAVADGSITPAQFLELNANAGSWKNEPDMVQERCPYPPFPCPSSADLAPLFGHPFPDIWPNLVDPWSANNMALSPDGGATPAPRVDADPGAVEAAYEHGLVNVGDIDIPMIDWRHYLERELNMHNSHQSFASRQRMLNFDGDASNQVIWFTDVAPHTPKFDQTPMAFEVIDEWMRNIAEHPERGVAGNKPPRAVDSCFDANGDLIAAGEDVWNGILDDEPPGPCTQRFPVYSTSRIQAGGPISGDVFVCHLMPVSEAVDRGLYGVWTPSPAEVARLEQIFPTGVCDYSKGDARRP